MRALFTSPLAGEVDTQSVAGEGDGITFLCVDRKGFPNPLSRRDSGDLPRKGEVKAHLQVDSAYPAKREDPMKLYCSTLLTLCTLHTAAACTLPTYQTSYHFTGVAHGTVEETLTGSAGHYAFHSITHAQKLWFHQTLITQTAGRVSQNQLQPQQVNDTAPPQQWIFTPQQLQLRQGATVLQTIALTAPTLDANSLALQLQLDLARHPDATEYTLTAALANAKQHVTLLPLTFTRQAATTLTFQQQTLTVNNLHTEYRLNSHTIETTYGFAPHWHNVLVQSQTAIDGNPIATATLSAIQWIGGCVTEQPEGAASFTSPPAGEVSKARSDFEGEG